MDGSTGLNTDCVDGQYKMVLVGDARCGKTALVTRFISNTFLETYTPTAFEKYSSIYEVGEYKIKFTVWDTSGSPSFDRVRPLAYQDARVFLLCFGINDPISLDNAIYKWYPEIRQHCDKAPIILCGCQSDMRNDIETISKLAEIKKIPVTLQQALNVSRDMNAVTYVETSARTSNTSVTDAFEIATRAFLGKLNRCHSQSVMRAVMQKNKSFIEGKSKSLLDIRHHAKSCSVM